MYNKLNNESFTSKLERLHNKSCLAITAVIQGTLCERHNKKLGLKSLIDRKWVCDLTLFYKIVKVNSPEYLSDYMKGNNNSVYGVEVRTKLH